jgi:hypothetical protein
MEAHYKVDGQSEYLLRLLKEAHHDWVHAPGKAYIDRVYQDMFTFGLIN